MRIPDNRNIYAKLFRHFRNGRDERTSNENCESHARKMVPRGGDQPRPIGALERSVKGRTRKKTSPCDKGDDGSFATRREPGVDEIVFGFSCRFGGKKWTLFCRHDTKGKSHN